MTYPLAERFVSINGEGQWAGKLSYFLRFPVCNLRCSYCDTKWVNEKGFTAKNLKLEEILAAVRASGVEQVTVTGGEPLLQPGMGDLLLALSELPGVQVEVETNGSVPLERFQAAAPRVSFTMDYKLPFSGMEERMHLPNLLLLRGRDALKLVCGSRGDLERARELLVEYNLSGRVPVFFSPVYGSLEPAEIVNFFKEAGLSQVRLQLQLHKFIWPPEQRGV